MDGDQGSPAIKFLPDGSLLNVQLKIMNLRKSSGGQHIWEQVNLSQLQTFYHQTGNDIDFLRFWFECENPKKSKTE